MRTQILLRLALTALIIFSFGAAAQVATGKSAFSQSTAPSATQNEYLNNLQFRNLGPAVAGGRITAVVGVPNHPEIYYAGSAAGGVFKSEDGATTWRYVSSQVPVPSVGAMAIVPSNPNLVWVGTGEANLRNDISPGGGVFFSPDAGASWRSMGLQDVGQIATIIVSPANPEVVFVAAFGHAWAPNAERGVFRSTDGGRTWKKVLYIDDKTGASDLVMDPANPMILYAGMWQAQRYPWMMISGGNSSGLYRSSDGGETWQKLSGGLPKPPLGRIGLAVAPSNPKHVYALVEPKEGVLWDSADYGEHWTKVSDNYPNDGGKTARIISRGVHPDHHALWIDPRDPNRLIEGNDGGVYTSWNGGQTWQFRDSLPIEQFYSIALDDRVPYTICGGLQDNSGWCGPSHTLARGPIANNEWWTTVGGDGQYVVPGLTASKLIYSDSQDGEIEVLDRESGQQRHIRPYLHNQGDMPISELKYRFNWTAPIAVSPANDKDVYLGANVLFHSTDAGEHWTPISPDLTRNDKSKQVVTGGDILKDLSSAENYDTILAISLSPLDAKVIWVGTDDGNIQVTQDGGQHWSNVASNIAQLPQWGRIRQIEASPATAGTAYVAVDFHEVDDHRPYVFKTHDFGKTWTAINRGLPSQAAHVVREDPNRRGLLVLGTETGLYYSVDEGEHWTALKSGFPATPVYDLKFEKRKHDLVIGTHGRGLFVLDDISPLEQLTAEVQNADLHLFEVTPAHLSSMFSRYGRSGGFSAPNRPAGALINYYLKQSIESRKSADSQPTMPPVKIVITGPDGQTVRTLHGPARAGVNRIAWDLRLDPPTSLRTGRGESENEGATESGGEEGFRRAGGPTALPGTYKVTLTANGHTESRNVEVGPDPRFPFDQQAAQAQLRAALEVRDQLSALNQALNRNGELRAQIKSMRTVLGGPERQDGDRYAKLLDSAQQLDGKLSKWQEAVYNPAVQNDPKYYLHYLARLNDRMQRLLSRINEDYDRAPSEEQTSEMAAVRSQVDEQVRSFNALLSDDVGKFNKMAADTGANTLYAGPAIALHGERPQTQVSGGR
ncbi:MAG: hypothetical protein DMG64_15610 [Acidobacteria bacterium]|nr:MAG: hypothetical protein DMG64_15610 [Acidobacteriota bacterium]